MIKKFMISLLDTHQHLMYRNEMRYDWTKDIPSLAKGDFTIEDYNTLTKGLGVGGSLFMEADADNYHKEVRFIQSLINNGNKSIKGIISSIRPEIKEGFDSWLNESVEIGVLGYRRILHETSDDVSQSEIFRTNIRKIGASNKTFDLCFLQKQLPVALDLAEVCDNTNLILDHCGVPDIVGGDIDYWKKYIEKLSKLPHVYCKLSGIMAYCPLNLYHLKQLNHILILF